jgi:hypothetical protein
LNTSTSFGLPQSVITTFAGVSAVDGAFANTQFIESPHGVTPDGRGGFYFAAGRSRVYRVTSDGRLTLVAGRGTPGFSGDGGPATSAQLHDPLSVAVDGDGTLYIADSTNRIRKVTPAGTISTVAGVGPPSNFQLDYPSGVAFDGHDNLLVASLGQMGTLKFPSSGSPSILANTTAPTSLAVDAAGDVFLTDASPWLREWSEENVRKLTPEGNLTSLGNDWYFFDYDEEAPAGEFCVAGIAVDKDGTCSSPRQSAKLFGESRPPA